MATKYTHTGDFNIREFIGAIEKSGGMSMSNLYEAKFEFNGGDAHSGLKKDLASIGFSDLSNASDTAYAALTLFCEEASLPGMMANTGQTTGVYMGEGQLNYAHTKSFTDITLGWTCDANLLPLKFINTWMNYIFNADSKILGTAKANRVRYPEEYQCTLKIVKAERGPTNTLERVGGIYTLHDIYPYSIQSTPVSYGSSTLLKVSSSFYYRRWSFQPINIKST
jgi:hypothetical protein